MTTLGATVALKVSVGPFAEGRLGTIVRNNLTSRWATIAYSHLNATPNRAEPTTRLLYFKPHLTAYEAHKLEVQTKGAIVIPVEEHELELVRPTNQINSN